MLWTGIGIAAGIEIGVIRFGVGATGGRGAERWASPWRAILSVALRVMVVGGGFLRDGLETGCAAAAGVGVLVEGMIGRVMGRIGAALGIAGDADAWRR